MYITLQISLYSTSDWRLTWFKASTTLCFVFPACSHVAICATQACLSSSTQASNSTAHCRRRYTPAHTHTVYITKQHIHVRSGESSIHAHTHLSTHTHTHCVRHKTAHTCAFWWVFHTCTHTLFKWKSAVHSLRSYYTVFEKTSAHWETNQTGIIY